MRRVLWLAASVSVLSAVLVSVHRNTEISYHHHVAAIHRSWGHTKQRLQPVFLAARFRARHQLTRVRHTGARQSRIHLLARLIQAEAGHTAYPTQVAVGAVVLNRLRSPHFPHRLAAVITQPQQFSVVAAGTFATSHPSLRALNAARAAFSGKDPTPGALYFYNPNMPHVSWMDTLVGCRTVGALRFCVGPH